MTEIWVCPNCNHEFDPEKQEPYWDCGGISINCPNCAVYMDIRHRKQWRKKNDKT